MKYSVRSHNQTGGVCLRAFDVLTAQQNCLSLHQQQRLERWELFT